jgi:hypothetical protein
MYLSVYDKISNIATIVGIAGFFAFSTLRRNQWVAMIISLTAIFFVLREYTIIWTDAIVLGGLYFGVAGVETSRPKVERYIKKKYEINKFLKKKECTCLYRMWAEDYRATPHFDNFEINNLIALKGDDFIMVDSLYKNLMPENSLSFENEKFKEIARLKPKTKDEVLLAVI